MNDKTALKSSSAGMRFIAQMTLQNNGDDARLREFFAASYTSSLLEQSSADERVRSAVDWRGAAGKLRVFQVVATDKHRVIVLLQAQQTEALYYAEMAVEEDYPHRVTEFKFHALQ